jgi:hypothetical protein
MLMSIPSFLSRPVKASLVNWLLWQRYGAFSLSSGSEVYYGRSQSTG